MEYRNKIVSEQFILIARFVVELLCKYHISSLVWAVILLSFFGVAACSSAPTSTPQQTLWARPTMPIEEPDLPELECVNEGSDVCVATLDANVLFATGSSMLSPESLWISDQLAELVKSRGAYVQLVGHADGQGDSASNQTLSEERVIAIKQALVERGIAKSMISTCGVGDLGAMPGVADQSYRRVEAILTYVAPEACPMR